MERNSPGALRAPGAFGASGTSDPRRQRHIGSSCDSLNLLPLIGPLHHARLLSRRGAAAEVFGRGTADDAACGRASASGAAFLCMRVCRRSVATAAAMRVCSLVAVLRPSRRLRRHSARPSDWHCGGAESGFIGRRRRLGRALYPPTDAGFE